MRADAPRISVVVCTRDRAASLSRSLDSLARCAPPQSSEWELVVVDNGSRDDTPRTLDAFRDRLPLCVVREPRLGLSIARNRGATAASGDYLLWTDDDATVCRDWLRRYEAAFTAHPDAAFFGGPIHVRFEGTPPRWLEASLPLVRHAFAGLEALGDGAILDARSPGLPFGANWAVRRSELLTFGFDPEIGRHPARLFAGHEESDVLRRITRAGGRGVWLPDASVEHWIDPSRQSRAYLRRYYTGVGFVGTRRSLAEEGRATGLGKQLRLLRRIAWQDLVYAGARLLGRREAWVQALREGARLRGRLIAHRRQGGDA
jgi:glycosyltransferase involved in cell wall biosynthesis